TRRVLFHNEQGITGRGCPECCLSLRERGVALHLSRSERRLSGSTVSPWFLTSTSGATLMEPSNSSDSGAGDQDITSNETQTSTPDAVTPRPPAQEPPVKNPPWCGRGSPPTELWLG